MNIAVKNETKLNSSGRPLQKGMRLTMLGTGNATVTECYNTCFVISENDRHFLIDGGGGNTLLHQLKCAGIFHADINEIFVTHKHIDHLLGIVWLIRIICQDMDKGQNRADVNIYAHEEVICLLRELSGKLLQKKQTRFLDDRVHLTVVDDGETRIINGRKVTFFDIHSTKAKQFGFCMESEHGKKLTCCGDEPYNPCEKDYAQDSNWLLHEAFCLHSQADVFAPYEKHHSTVKDACELAEKLRVKNLILYHTEDQNIENRKKLYYEEGSRYFHGNLYIPDDLECIAL